MYNNKLALSCSSVFALLFSKKKKKAESTLSRHFSLHSLTYSPSLPSHSSHNTKTAPGPI